MGSERAAAPQAQLMSTVINGILSRKLPWGLVMLGVFLVVTVELLGIRSLAFAVGAYLRAHVELILELTENTLSRTSSTRRPAIIPHTCVFLPNATTSGATPNC